VFSLLLSIYQKEQPLFFHQSLDSIFSQTLLPNEVIIVKDGPLTKELDCIISEYSQTYPIIKIVALSINQGLGKALNEGLKYCSYDLVARMDTDDIAKSNRFEKQIQIFQKYPDIDVVGTWIDEFDDNISNITSIRKLPEYHQEISKFAKRRNPINHPTVMFKKSTVIAAGGYRHFFLFEDYYLWVRMLMNGAKFYNIQESLLFFRFSPDMFKRRGGWKYAIDEFKFQKTIRQTGFISSMDFIRNVSIRFMTRIVPNFLRIFLYRMLLRK
jgi:glycosyltransferase involved in cell wall biosynthesis